MFSDYKVIILEMITKDIGKAIGGISNICKLNTLLNNSWIKEEINREIRKYFELNENESICQHLWYTVKTVFIGKFKTLNSYVRKCLNSQINNSSFYLKKLEKKYSTLNPKEIMKTRTEINKIKIRIEKIIENKH